MSRKDQFHEAVKYALEKDDWLITHDPFTIQISEAVKLKIDLGAESTIAAQRAQEKIAIEIKSFITDSDIATANFVRTNRISHLSWLWFC
jgi:XisH protein